MKIYIADNDIKHTELLEEVIPSIPGVKSVAIFPYSAQAMCYIDQYKPDVVIMDNIKDGVFDAALLERTREQNPDALIVVYTDKQNKRYHMVSQDIGIDHFAYKNAGTEYVKFVVWDHIQTHAEKETSTLRGNSSRSGS